MSDTDNESAFESADEGEEGFNQDQAGMQQPSAPTSNEELSNLHVSQQEEHNDVLGSSFSSENGLLQKGNVPNQNQAGEHDAENETIDVSEASSLQQCGANLDSQQDDEGLGDWDVGWEIDEDVLTANSSSNSTNILKVKEKCDNSMEVSQETAELETGNMRPTEASNTSGGGYSESQAKECTPTRKIERSANKDRVLDKLCDASEQRQSQTSGWGWGSWGTSILSTATSSMSTFTSQVGHGLNSVLESVEATLGAPSPEELANQQSTSTESENVVQELHIEEASTSSCDQNMQSQSFLGTPLALSVGNISSKVITGSLDTLELIGRKTMDILQEGDPGFKKKRSLLKTEKPVLSEVLREAKEQESETSLTDENPGGYKINFSTIFDDCQGLVHLEALEMLSKQSEQRIQVGLLSLIDDELSDMQRSLENIKDIYESQTDVDTEDNHLEQEFNNLLSQNLAGLNVVTNLEKLFKAQCDSQTWLQQCRTDQDKGEKKDANDIHTKAIHFMAEFTARAVEVIHKMAELTLVMDNMDLTQAVPSFASFANVLCMEVAMQSSKYSTCLSTAADDSEDPNSVNPLITNVFLEASNSNTYIQDACHLLVPIFQLKLITSTKNKELEE